METIKENFIFKKAYNKGEKQADKFVVLYSLKRKKGVRYGVTVSKKIGKAVVRNRLRRQFRECLRVLEPYINDGQDIVLVARSAAVYAPYSALLDSIRSQMLKGGMLCEESVNTSD